MSFKRGKFSTGVAAGMEFDDSGDEFMFGDDDYDEKPVPTKVIPKPSTQTTTTTRIAPWVIDQDKEKHAVYSKKKDASFEVTGHDEKTGSTILRLEDEEIRTAINQGNVDFIRDAIHSGFKVDSRMKSGWTALIYAASAGNLEIVKLLLENGANANFHKDMFTPIMALCLSTGSFENFCTCAELLVDAGARVNVHDRHLVTPLMYAAQMGRHELVQFLITNKAQIDAQDNRGWTALAFAANSGHVHVVKVLLENKALASLCAYDGQSPADLAYSKGFTPVVDILENGDLDVNGRDEKLLHPRSTIKSKHTRYKKLEELEMFLLGLDLGNLVDIFQEQQITFQEFLKLNEEDLLKVGVTQLGARKRILEAIRGVHTNEWDLSGLSVDNKSKISTIEAAAIAVNVSKHLDFIRSTISFLKDYIQTNKDSIEKDDPSTQKSLVDQCKIAHSVSQMVQDDLHLLQAFVKKELTLASKRHCDSIAARNVTANGSRSYVLPFIGCLTLLSFFAYKYFDR